MQATVDAKHARPLAASFVLRPPSHSADGCSTSGPTTS
jgi:hypothetical protein